MNPQFQELQENITFVSSCLKGEVIGYAKSIKEAQKQLGMVKTKKNENYIDEEYETVFFEVRGILINKLVDNLSGSDIDETRQLLDDLKQTLTIYGEALKLYKKINRDDEIQDVLDIMYDIEAKMDLLIFNLGMYPITSYSDDEGPVVNKVVEDGKKDLVVVGQEMGGIFELCEKLERKCKDIIR